MSSKNILFGIATGLTASTIFSIVLKIVKEEMKLRKVFSQGEPYLDAAALNFNNGLVNMSRRINHRRNRPIKIHTRMASLGTLFT